jgi:hypothetical protein
MGQPSTCSAASNASLVFYRVSVVAKVKEFLAGGISVWRRRQWDSTAVREFTRIGTVLSCPFADNDQRI